MGFSRNLIRLISTVLQLFIKTKLLLCRTPFFKSENQALYNLGALFFRNVKYHPWGSAVFSKNRGCLLTKPINNGTPPEILSSFLYYYYP